MQLPDDSDWIAPGEFSFCSRCGDANTCRIGNVFFWCKDHPPPIEGTVVYGLRAALANFRKAAGYQPKWWTKQEGKDAATGRGDPRRLPRGHARHGGRVRQRCCD